MQLSILIPSYHYDSKELVRTLDEQCREVGVDYEIVVGEEPLSSAAHRNLLADRAKGEWLIFIDADAKAERSDYIENYLKAQSIGADVVCGGLYHPDVNPNPDATLRYLYERNADRRRAARYRMQHPYDNFTPFNVMIRREVFMQVRFDEECKEYGYEDVLFGEELRKRNISITHIDNPLCHMGLEDNNTYLYKVQASLRTLKKMDRKIGRSSKLKNAADRLERLGLLGAYRKFFSIARKHLRNNLLSQNPSLTYLKLYKLGYYITL